MNYSDQIRFYFATTVLPIGIIFSTIAFSIFIKARLNRNSIFGYLHAWLCVFDILSLSNEIIFATLAYLNIDAITYSTVTCKIIYGWVKYVNHLPSFQSVIIALYLYITICHQKRRDLIHKYKLFFILAMIGFVTFVDAFYSVYNKNKAIVEYQITNRSFLLRESIQSYSSNESYCEAPFLTDFFLDMTNVVMRDFIPFMLIFSFNFLSIKGFIRSRTTSCGIRRKRKENQFLYSIISSNFIFLGIYLPWAIVFILYHINDSFTLFPDLINSDLFEITTTVFECLAYLNNMTCFFLNITFNSHFIHEFLVLSKMKRDIQGHSTNLNTNTQIN